MSTNSSATKQTPRKSPLISCVCAGCHTDFLAEKRYGREQPKYCSLQCLGASRKKPDHERSQRHRSSKQCLCTRCKETCMAKSAELALCRRCIMVKAGRAKQAKHPSTGAANPRWKNGAYAENPKKWWKEWKRKNRIKNLVKYKARDKARYAFATGLIVKTPCSDCGTDIDLQMHHENYGKPLEVIWLCRPCHNGRHGKGQRRKEGILHCSC